LRTHFAESTRPTTPESTDIKTHRSPNRRRQHHVAEVLPDEKQQTSNYSKHQAADNCEEDLLIAHETTTSRNLNHGLPLKLLYYSLALSLVMSSIGKVPPGKFG